MYIRNTRRTKVGFKYCYAVSLSQHPKKGWRFWRSQRFEWCGVLFEIRGQMPLTNQTAFLLLAKLRPPTRALRNHHSDALMYQLYHHIAITVCVTWYVRTIWSLVATVHFKMESFQVNDAVEVIDPETGRWTAAIITSLPNDNTVLVRYPGWGRKWSSGEVNLVREPTTLLRKRRRSRPENAVNLLKLERGDAVHLPFEDTVIVPRLDDEQRSFWVIQPAFQLCVWRPSELF